MSTGSRITNEAVRLTVFYHQLQITPYRMIPLIEIKITDASRESS